MSSIKSWVGMSALLACCAVSQAGFAAGLSAGDKIKLEDSFGASPGGEFKATVLSGIDTGVTFMTFCVEKNETFSYGHTLWVKAVNTKAVNGGVGGGNPDPLDSRTAYLYTKFRAGTLSNYDYGNNAAHVDDGTALQAAIWKIEQEITSFSGYSAAVAAQANAWITEAQNAITGGTWAGIGGVRILNLYKDAAYTSFAQDQLYLAPIPEPETYAMLAAGLGLMGFVARRRKQQALPA